MSAPERLTDEEVQRAFPNGPRIGPGAVMVSIGERIYKRERGVWRLLDNRVFANTGELANGSEES